MCKGCARTWALDSWRLQLPGRLHSCALWASVEHLYPSPHDVIRDRYQVDAHCLDQRKLHGEEKCRYSVANLMGEGLLVAG